MKRGSVVVSCRAHKRKLGRRTGQWAFLEKALLVRLGPFEGGEEEEKGDSSRRNRLNKCEGFLRYTSMGFMLVFFFFLVGHVCGVLFFETAGNLDSTARSCERSYIASLVLSKKNYDYLTINNLS